MTLREEYEKTTQLAISYLRRAVEAEEKLRMIKSLIDIEVFRVESLPGCIEEEEDIDRED